MQALASPSCLRAARPFTATRLAAAPRPSNAGSRQWANKQQSTRLAATAQEIEDLEDIDIVMPAAGSSSSAVSSALPSEKVKLRVRMRGYDVGILGSACSQIADIAALTGARVAGPVHLPTKKKIYCVLRSPHVNKDAREHFEIRIHHRLVDLSNLSAQTVQALMEWVPPSGLEVQTSIV